MDLRQIWKIVTTKTMDPMETEVFLNDLKLSGIRDVKFDIGIDSNAILRLEIALDGTLNDFVLDKTKKASDDIFIEAKSSEAVKILTINRE